MVAAASTVLTAPPRPVLVAVGARCRGGGWGGVRTLGGYGESGAANNAAMANGAIRRACMDVLPSRDSPSTLTRCPWDVDRPLGWL